MTAKTFALTVVKFTPLVLFLWAIWLAVSPSFASAWGRNTNHGGRSGSHSDRAQHHRGSHTRGSGSGSSTSTPPVVIPTPLPTPTPTPPTTSGNEIRFTAYNTLYASGDNTPAGSTQIDLGGHSGNAGGTGTYNDPITLAVGGSLASGSEVDDYPYGTKFYIPAFRKYFIAEDFCGDGSAPQNEPCHKSEMPGYSQLDLYAGDAGGSGVLDCEDSLTGTHLMIENPASNYAVVPGPIYNASCPSSYGDAIVAI
jgi:hypothetical protein